MKPVYVFTTISPDGVVQMLSLGDVDGMVYTPTPPDRGYIDTFVAGTQLRCQAIIGSAVLPVWSFTSREAAS